jgi:uncharacterized protein YndB with AHSA1/START domain
MADTITMREIGAPQDRVFAALLHPRDLTQWFCDTADVEPRVGGRYVFGGPHAYGGPAVADGRVVTVEADQSLSFVWPLAGAETTVTYELNTAPGGVMLTARHTGVERFPYEVYSSEHAAAVWAVLLRQLAAHVEGRPLPRWDFSRVPPKTVRSELRIAAPVARVWEMLTVSAQMNRWIAKNASIDLRVGGRYSYGWPEDRDGPLTIVELDPPRRLVVSWRAADVLGTVRWELTGGDRATALVLTHEGLPDHAGVRRDYDIGWWDFIVDMKRLTEMRSD